MTNSLSDDFSQSFDQLSTHIGQLNTSLDRTLSALQKHGVQISVDIGGMAKTVQQDVKVVERKGLIVFEQLDQLQELVRTVALITSSLELDQVLAEVMDTVIQLTGAERAYLMLRAKDTDELTIWAARNWDRETLAETDTVFSSSIVNEALEKMEAVVTTNAQDDARFQELKSVVQHGLRSVLCIPLTMRGRVIGVLYADNRIDQGVFSQHNVPLLTAFGTQAAIAIENARQFKQVKDDLQQAQRELQHLQIQIDQQKLAQQVSDITESEYFEHLAAVAQSIRQTRRSRQG
jgi:GAF domain-containing protein